jgi:hypothetical protein
MIMTVQIEIESEDADTSKNFRADRTVDATLTTEHSQSSYGVPVLVMPDGGVYGSCDIVPGTRCKAHVAVVLANSQHSGQDTPQFDIINRFRHSDPVWAGR